MKITKSLLIDGAIVEDCNRYLRGGLPEGEHLGEDETISFTTKFRNGVEMEIKVCGVRWEPDSTDGNAAWSEAVLFQDGSEVACSDAGDTLLGEWELEYNGITYCVVAETEAQATDKPKKRDRIQLSCELWIEDGNAMVEFTDRKTGIKTGAVVPYSPDEHPKFDSEVGVLLYDFLNELDPEPDEEN